MSGLEDLGKITDADVLVIGGGFAGAWAAIRAKEFVNEVVLVEKAKVARSGCSTFAAGVQFCPMEGDDLDVWKNEIVEAGGYFSDQEWVDIFLRNQIERIKDYEKWGAPLERDEKGNIARIVGRAHVNTRIFQFHGPELMAFLRKQMFEKGVKLVERVMVIDLLTSDGSHPTKGSVVGAVGFDTRTAEPQIFRAKATVLAAGGVSWKKGDVRDTCTGDGGAIAFRAGAELVNMEFLTSGNIIVWQRKGISEGINMIQGHGAYFVNAKGVRFMKKYDAVLMERAQLYKLCMAFAKEAMEGRGPVYVDMRHFTPETFNKFRRVIPKSMKFWSTLGIDISKQMIECTPSWGVGGAVGAGGINVGKMCETNIQGLYAVGAVARNPVAGIYGLGGVATAVCNVMGYIAGEHAAASAGHVKEVKVDLHQIKSFQENIASLLRVKAGIAPSEFFTRLELTTIPARFSMFKNARRISRVLSEVAKINQDLPKLAAPDAHELVKANEFKNYLLITELSFRAALGREESRQYHYREEYPYIDNKDWLKLIVFKREGERITIRYEPIPIDKWSLKPKRSIKVSHPIQMFLED